jgi:hypothetical protein
MKWNRLYHLVLFLYSLSEGGIKKYFLGIVGLSVPKEQEKAKKPTAAHF